MVSLIAIIMIIIPYSQKYWWLFNLAVQLQTGNTNINLSVGLAKVKVLLLSMRMKKYWRNLIRQFKRQPLNCQISLSANISGYMVLP